MMQLRNVICICIGEQLFKFCNNFAGGKNWALFRPATQSTTLNDSPGSAASQAVDGDTWSGSTTHYSDYNPWWKVQLAFTIWVTNVEIVNDDDDKGM